LSDPDTQQLLLSIQLDAQSQIHCFDAHRTVITHFDVDAI